MNENLRKAMQKFFGEIAKHGEGAVPEASIDCYRLLGGDVKDLKLDELPEEEPEGDEEPVNAPKEEPVNAPKEEPVGDQD